MKRGQMYFMLAIGAAMLVLGVTGLFGLWGRGDTSALRKTGHRAAARFSNLQCQASGGGAHRTQHSSTACQIDIEFDRPEGGVYRSRVGIASELVDCSAGPPFHLTKPPLKKVVQFPVFFKPEAPQAFVFGPNPCGFEIPFWLKMLGLTLAGIAIAGVAVWLRVWLRD
jgi:hypothetical protein